MVLDTIKLDTPPNFAELQEKFGKNAILTRYDSPVKLTDEELADKEVVICPDATEIHLDGSENIKLIVGQNAQKITGVNYGAEIYPASKAHIEFNRPKAPEYE